MTTLRQLRRFRSGPLLGRLWLLLVSALWLSSAPAAVAQTRLDEYAVKAALLFNIVKYTDWPAESFHAPDSPIVIGVLGTDPFGPALDRVVSGRLVNGRPIVVRRATGIAPLQGAHLVFVSASQPYPRQDCAAFESAGVLTVGDSTFLADYAAICFLFEGERIAFTVDLGRAMRTGATFSSHLLKFAKSVTRPDDMVTR